jgi:hypothetical protein
MKTKYLIVLILLIAISNVNAQKSIVEKSLLIEKTEKLLSDYKEYSSFTQMDKSGFSEATATKFRDLFTEKALVFDNLVTGYFDNEKNFPQNIRLKSRKIDDYIRRVKEVFPNGIKANILNVTANYYGLNNNNFNFVLTRKFTAIAKNELIVECIDTVLVRCIILNNGQDLKINEVFSISYALTFKNDKDKDYVLDDFDNCISIRGIAENKGCPANDGPQMFFSPSIGYGINSISMSGPTSENIGYNSYVGNRSSIGSLIQGNGVKSTLTLGAEFEYYFRWQRKWGLGFGILYQNNSYSAGLSANNFRAEYKAFENNTNIEYRRMVSVNSLTESNTLNNLMIPICLKYKKHLSSESKLWLNFDLGIAYNLFLDGSSSSESNINYEAAYNYENSNFTFKSNSSANEMLMTREQYYQYFANKNPGLSVKGIESLVDAEFEKRKSEGYDVGTNEQVNGSTTYNFNSGLAFFARPSLTYQLNKSFFIFGGFMFSSASYTNSNSENFKLSDKVGEYNTLLNGTNSITINSVSMFLGTKIAIKK